MANKSSGVPLIYAIDAGNGGVRGLSSGVSEVVQFEPVIAPLTNKKGIEGQEGSPDFSLTTEGKTEVFGVKDVFTHGKRDFIRRLNSQERYTNSDYFKLLECLFLHLFPTGNPEYITPTGVISVPARQYNDSAVVTEIKETWIGKHVLTDYNGCELKVDIQPKRFNVIVESYGAMMHYAFDPKKLVSRPDTNTNGSTLVVDVGYETANQTLFEGTAYQRDRAFTLLRGGFGVVTRAVMEYAQAGVRDVDVSRLDKALQAVAGSKPGSKKIVEVAPGIMVDITDVYDDQVAGLAKRIADSVMTNYTEAVNRVLLSGGAVHHLKAYLEDALSPMPVVVAPDPDIANVCGAFTMLNIQLRR